VDRMWIGMVDFCVILLSMLMDCIRLLFVGVAVVDMLIRLEVIELSVLVILGSLWWVYFMKLWNCWDCVKFVNFCVRIFVYWLLFLSSGMVVCRFEIRLLVLIDKVLFRCLLRDLMLLFSVGKKVLRVFIVDSSLGVIVCVDVVLRLFSRFLVFLSCLLRFVLSVVFCSISCW